MEKKSLSVMFCVVIISSVLLVAMLPVAYTPSTLELVGAVPPTDGISINYIDGMEILDSNPEELLFTSRNEGAVCGGGTPASVWKMIIDQNTGKMVSVELIQMLSKIQDTRHDLFESSDGTLFTGGGWCGYKPAYYSADGGQTWQSADSGPVHPPNSVFSFVEFNGDVYAGTGYEPYHGEVYRWLGNGNWEKVLDTGIVRNIVDAMVVYDNRLFVGSQPYGYSGSACAGTIPVLVSSDGNIFNPTTGMPGCHWVLKFFVVGNQLVAYVQDRISSQEYIYHWNDISETWEEVAAYHLGWTHAGMLSHNGVIYAYGQAPSDAAAGLYQSVDLGLTWQQIAVLENPDASSMTIHDGTLYIGTFRDANYTAYIYSWTPISWEYVFEDPCRDTMLKISTDDKYFRFVAPDKTFSVKHDADMIVMEHFIFINFEDSEIRLLSIAIDTTIDFCVGFAKDMETVQIYWLVDRPDNWIPGDVDADYDVDIFDIGYISAHWHPGPPIGPSGYNANADINSDGVVDIFDIGIASANWGES